MSGVMGGSSNHQLRRAELLVEDYDDLPAPIKLFIGPHEYIFMTDAQKARLIQDETEPEY